MSTKDNRYHAQLQRTLGEMYEKMESKLAWLTEGTIVEEDHLTPEQWSSVRDVNSMEEEWLLDPVQRQSLSLLHWEEDVEDS